MRTKNSFLNFLANTGNYIINLILSFVCRTVFIYSLSEKYLGVNGLFGNILTMLSLAELGIGTAMLYKMYKPVAEDDFQMQQQLMNLFKRMYEIVAAVVLVLGLSIVPFLDVFIKDQPDIPHLTGIYLLYLFNTVSTYLFSYKRSIIDAHQKSYIITVISSAFTAAQFVLQIAILFLTHNFIAYLCIQIACSLLTNVVISVWADRMYPFLKQDRKSLPDKAVRKDIFKNISAMFMHRLGDVVVNNTDNLFMSAFVGLSAVGIYSNYQMIMGSIKTAIIGIFHAFTASIGDMGATEDKEHLFGVYKVLYFLSFWIYGFAATTFVVLYNPFIEAWAGKKLLFPMSVVVIIVINFYIAGIRDVTLIFRDALGLFWYDRYKPVFEVIVDLTISFFLVVKMGTFGIFLGTTISTMTTCFWIEPLITYKYGFNKKVGHYFKMFALYAAVTAVIGGITYWICSAVTMGGFLEVFVKLLIVVLFYNLVIFLLFRKTVEFQALLQQAERLWQSYKEEHK